MMRSRAGYQTVAALLSLAEGELGFEGSVYFFCLSAEKANEKIISRIEQTRCASPINEEPPETKLIEK